MDSGGVLRAAFAGVASAVTDGVLGGVASAASGADEPGDDAFFPVGSWV